MTFRILIFWGLITIAGPAFTQAQRVVPNSQQQVLMSFAPVVERVTPSVVNIYQLPIQQQNQTLGTNNSIFQHFFGNRFQATKKPRSSLGSGVIVSQDGMIVTNQHVIGGGGIIKVVLSHGAIYEASVVFADERSDLAVLQLNDVKAPLTPVNFTNFEPIVGDLVLAIGNPFGVGQTVTSGIVSAIARSNKGISDFQSFIQTDAAINPGNSGGALVNMQGEVIGINTAIFSNSGGSIGIGFAIPARTVKAVMRRVALGEDFQPIWLGVRIIDVDNEIAEALGLDAPRGVVLESISDNGPMGKAGFLVGDIIIAVDSYQIQNSTDLRYAIAALDKDTRITVDFVRDGVKNSKIATLDYAPNLPAPDYYQGPGSTPFLGATLANISPMLALESGMDGLSEGVTIVALAPNSIAYNLGFKAHDIIRFINESQIDSVANMRTLLQGKIEQWHIAIERDGNKLELRLR